MLGFESIAIFMLATVGRDVENYQARIAPLVDGWGAYFPHLHFVFGRNIYDKRFLDRECRLIPESDVPLTHKQTHPQTETQATSIRQLVARYAQTPVRHKMLTYQCKTAAGNKFFGLFSGNCTGEYYGIGPTCRCQESIRYYITLSEHPQQPFFNTDWFIFMDDDLFLKPFALLSLLSQFDDARGDAVALVAGTKGEFRHEKSHPECHRQFSMAMPGVLSRKAVEVIAPAIRANGMTAAQTHWRGTHDVLFGFILWVYDITVMPMYPAGAFAGVPSDAWFTNLTSVKGQRVLDRMNGCVMFHGIKAGKSVTQELMQKMLPFPSPPPRLIMSAAVGAETIGRPTGHTDDTVAVNWSLPELQKDVADAARAYAQLRANFGSSRNNYNQTAGRSESSGSTEFTSAITGTSTGTSTKSRGRGGKHTSGSAAANHDLLSAPTNVNKSLALRAFHLKHNLSQSFALFRKEDCLPEAYSSLLVN